MSVEQEVRENVLRQPVGPMTLEVLALPDDFVRRIVDRVIRVSYQEQYHMVVRDPGTESPDIETPDRDAATQPPIPPNDAHRPNITVRRFDAGEEADRYRRSMLASRPFLRGFTAPILTHRGERLRPDEFGADASAALRRATRFVARRLAFDGLRTTLMNAIEIIGPQRIPDDAVRAADLLRSTGLPVDLLKHFIVAPQPPDVPLAVLRFVTDRLSRGAKIETIKAQLDALPFRWSKTAAGFRVATESGEHDIGAVRLQLARGAYWKGVGTGANVDVARQLIERFPQASISVTIEENHVKPFLALARGWSQADPSRLSVFASPLPVSQWAQDNGKAGVLEPPQAATRTTATLVPRFASRRDDGSLFVPNESFLMDAMADAGHTVIQSPLLFQGGNLMAVRVPASGERILLIGEAEIHRNVALGLTPDQVAEAFRVEFGVDRVAVLPAVSFHIDFEVTVRARGDRLIACVNDSRSAVRIILACGLDALQRRGVLDAGGRRSAGRLLREDKAIEFVNLVGGIVRQQVTPSGHYPLSLARAFQVGPSDSGVGNLQRFLLAIDLLAGWNIRPEQWPTERHARAYVNAIQRRESDRAELYRQLVSLGFEVVGVPSLAEGERGVNYLNGIQDRSRYLMPAYGGLFGPLDTVAAAALGRAFGPGVEIVPILSGESQRRGGAVHCATCVYPKLSD